MKLSLTIMISIHALLAESDAPTTRRNNKNNVFLSTLSLRRATNGRADYIERNKISIHALLAESDRYKQHRLQCNFYFYPRSPCGERLVKFSVSGSVISISIHALLAESDALAPEENPTQQNFYPRSPCGERLFGFWTTRSHPLFLSTLSLRRATPRGGLRYLDNIISIHALLAESDRQIKQTCQSKLVFLSTLSLRRATSIAFKLIICLKDFYPRSPCGERPTVHQ